MGRIGGVEPGGLGRGSALGVCVAALLWGAAQAQPAPTPAPQAGDVPASNAEADILRWIATRTSIPRTTILMLEPKAVVALAGKTPPAATGLAHADIREELISPESKTRSAMFSVDLDCTGHKFRIITRRTYALPDLKGDSQVNPEPAPWTAVNDGAPVAKAWQAVCTNDFAYPYATQMASHSAPVQRASAPIPTSPSAPRAASRLAAAAPARRLAVAAPAPPPAPRIASAGGDYEAVLGAYTVKDNAVAASEKLDHVLSNDLAGRRKALVTATVKGKVYTVLTVSGFASAEDASDFCKAARNIPLECIAKRGGAD
jgi:hypothetical protein